MKVTIKNFQSIENCSFEIPEKAFTCVVGPSNIGKSALRRALTCLLYNQSEESYIRTGSKECSVEVIFDSGKNVIWKRNTDTSWYIIDGVPFTKLNKSVPQAILDMGFKELSLNKEKPVSVQVAKQFSKTFLLEETGGKVTEVFSNLGNLNKIISANKACSSDLKSNKSKISIRKDDLFLAKEKIKNFTGLDEQRHLLDILKDNFLDIKKLKEKIENLKRLFKKLNFSVSAVRALKPVYNIILESFDIDLNILSNLKNLSKKYLVTEKNVNSYFKLNEIKEISFELTKEYTLFSSLLSKHKLYEKLCAKSILYKDLKEQTPQIGDIDLTKLFLIKNIYSRVIKSKNEILGLREKISETENKLQFFDKEITSVKETLKICPLCGTEFKKGDSCLS